jgi:hypothetical protein
LDWGDGLALLGRLFFDLLLLGSINLDILDSNFITVVCILYLNDLLRFFHQDDGIINFDWLWAFWKNGYGYQARPMNKFGQFTFFFDIIVEFNVILLHVFLLLVILLLLLVLFNLIFTLFFIHLLKVFFILVLEIRSFLNWIWLVIISAAENSEPESASLWGTGHYLLNSGRFPLASGRFDGGRCAVLRDFFFFLWRLQHNLKTVII